MKWILVKMQRKTNSTRLSPLKEVNISTHIHNERIKTKYIPSFIFENEGKIFKKLKRRILPKLNEFPEIYDVQILTVICIHN